MMQVGKIEFEPSKTYISYCPDCDKLKSENAVLQAKLDKVQAILEAALKRAKGEGIE